MEGGIRKNFIYYEENDIFQNSHNKMDIHKLNNLIRVFDQKVGTLWEIKETYKSYNNLPIRKLMSMGGGTAAVAAIYYLYTGQVPDGLLWYIAARDDGLKTNISSDHRVLENGEARNLKEKYGITGREIKLDINEAIKELKKGKKILVHVNKGQTQLGRDPNKKSRWTYFGHYIVFADYNESNNKICIFDPNNNLHSNDTTKDQSGFYSPEYIKEYGNCVDFIVIEQIPNSFKGEEEEEKREEVEEDVEEEEKDEEEHENENKKPKWRRRQRQRQRVHPPQKKIEDQLKVLNEVFDQGVGKLWDIDKSYKSETNLPLKKLMKYGCGTACAAAIYYLYTDKYPDGFSFYKAARDDGLKTSNSGNHNVLNKGRAKNLREKYGIIGRRIKNDINEAIKELKKGKKILVHVINGRHEIKSKWTTNCGHYITFTGYNEERDEICIFDPNGFENAKYKNKNGSGFFSPQYIQENANYSHFTVIENEKTKPIKVNVRKKWRFLKYEEEKKFEDYNDDEVNEGENDVNEDY